VFDPLAVLMLVAANWSLKHARKEHPDNIIKKFSENFVNNQVKVEEPEDTVWDEILNEQPEEIEWPEDDTRVDIIGTNGNEGLHYGEINKGWDPKFNVARETIETEVENLQQVGVKIKRVEYDSAGRRITP
jgi:hypothetical protein